MTMTDHETAGDVSEGEAAIFAVQRLAKRLEDAQRSDPQRALLGVVEQLRVTRLLLNEACGMMKVLDRQTPHAAVDEFLARVAAARALNQPQQIAAVDPSADSNTGKPSTRDDV